MTNWDEATIASAFAPENRRGRSPVYATTPGARSLGVRRQGLGGESDAVGVAAGNAAFNVSIPIVSLPGRGLDLALSLNYNSRLWQAAGDRIFFDPDGDWPAPGWSLGFGRLVRIGFSSMAYLIDATNARHPFTGTTTEFSDEFWRFSAHTTDGTLIDYTVDTRGRRTGTYSAFVNYPNGTFVDYRAPERRPSTGSIYPTRITDTNGNFITIAYRDGTSPELETITDTAGRSISFHYDGLLLTAITGPGLNGTSRVLARFHYRQLALDSELL